MKLYLSSYRVPTPKDLAKLVGKDFVDMKVALITNAKDYYIPRARQLKTDKTIQLFESLGVKDITEIDLRAFNDSDAVENELGDYDLIWSNGGNTFMLRYEMKRSGFDNAIKKLLEQGIVYGGESAGAIVVGASLQGIETMDVAEFADEIIWDGVKLLDVTIMPHADNPIYSSQVLEVTKRRKEALVVTLKDSQAYVVDGAVTFIVEEEGSEL